MRWLKISFFVTISLFFASAVFAHPSFATVNNPVLTSVVVLGGGTGFQSIPISPEPKRTGDFPTRFVSKPPRSSGNQPHNHSHSSNLTIKEATLVMEGGKQYDSVTKKWGFREPFKGSKRERFLLSFESKRVKLSGRVGLPGNLQYSTMTSGDYFHGIRFD